MNDQAVIIIEKNKLIDSAYPHIFKYQGYNNIVYTINTKTKTFDCFKFIDKSI